MSSGDRLPGTDAARQRAASAARCAVALRDEGRSTVAQVAERTGLSRPTVGAALESLRGRGLVAMIDEQTVGGRGAGRPARLYEFVAEAAYLVGVDVGIHRVRIAVADLRGRVAGWLEREVAASFVGAERLEGVKAAVRDCLAGAGVDRSRLAGMTVAVSGMVGPDNRLIVSRNFPDWESVDIAGHLRSEFGCEVAVENDMRLAALAEHRMGAARLVDDVVYFFAGHRISMGLILGGRLRRGSHSAAGEVGDIVFTMQMDESGQLRWQSAPTGEAVFRAAADGDEAARDEIERFVGGLAVGIATVTIAIDPDVVVIGGGLSRAGEGLLGPLRRAVIGAITVPVRPAIIQSELGAESVVLGALAHAFGASGERVYGTDGVPEPDIDVAGARRLAAEGIA